MSFLIAAAGTGGHVFPGLAVAEALIDLGIDKSDISFVGGDRLEASVYPDAGYGFLQLELRGLKRSLSPSNLTLPRVMFRARDRIMEAIDQLGTRSVLGMGGYVTIPLSMAARKAKTPLFLSEQNAGAGLANRIASRWADRTFVSFPETEGLEMGEWVGNPVRANISKFDRVALRETAFDHFGLLDGLPVVGVFGGSLGAASINEAVAAMASEWPGEPVQILHLVGSSHTEKFAAVPTPSKVRWIRRGFEERMDLFFAAIDLVVARAGGAVAEITATATPSILVPGDFGSSGHQDANAEYLAKEGAAIVLAQDDLLRLESLVSRLLGDQGQLDSMAKAAKRIARPDAAKVVGQAMIDGSR